MYKLFLLKNEVDNSTYYLKSKLDINILINLLKSYKNDDKSPYYQILKDFNYSIKLLAKYETLDELKLAHQNSIDNDINCIQTKKKTINKQIKKKYIYPKEKIQEYNKRCYEEFKNSPKYKEQLENLKQKQKEKRLEKRKESLKRKLEELENIENKTNQ